MTENTRFDPAAAGWTTSGDDGFIGLVGPFWMRETDGVRTYGFAAQPRHANLLGVVQGGMLMTFADRALGMEAWAAIGNRPSTTVQFNMNFVTSAAIGSFVTITPRVVRTTRTLIFLDGSLRSGATELATVQGLWKVVWQAPEPDAKE